MGMVFVFFKLDINWFLNALQAQYKLSLVRDLVSLSTLSSPNSEKQFSRKIPEKEFAVLF